MSSKSKSSITDVSIKKTKKEVKRISKWIRRLRHKMCKFHRADYGNLSIQIVLSNALKTAQSVKQNLKKKIRQRLQLLYKTKKQIVITKVAEEEKEEDDEDVDVI